MEGDIKGWRVGKKEAEDRRAARGEGSYKSSRSRSYKGGSYKRGGWGDMG